MSTLLVAQPGGHLQELHRLLPRLAGIDDDRTWVTVDSPQARSLLPGENVVYVPGARYPHDVAVTERNLRVAFRLFRSHRFDHVVSTGSGIALSFLPVARLWGASCHYIESSTRVEGPSLTARLLRMVPGVRLYTQHRKWSAARVRFEGSVFDGFALLDEVGTGEVRRIVVTVGSSPYGFRALVARVAELVPGGAEVVWQTGSTDVAGLEGLGVRPTRSMDPLSLSDAVRRADVVIGHAGVGTALTALSAGRWPILVPRRPERGEHVDAHQVDVARYFDRAGLALVREADRLEAEDLRTASRRRVAERPVTDRFHLS